MQRPYANRNRLRPRYKLRAKQPYRRRKPDTRNLSTYILRERLADRSITTVKEVTRSDYDAWTLPEVEDVVNQLPYFNPAVEETRTTVDFNAGTYAKKIWFSSLDSSCYAKNNYNVPVTIQIFLCIPKIDTNTTILNAFLNGVTDVAKPGDTYGATTPMLRLTDSPIFNNIWRVVKKKSKTVLPGGGVYLSHTAGGFWYSPQITDNNSNVYQKSLGAHAYHVVIQAALSHDSVVTTQVGYDIAAVDLLKKRSACVKYDGGGVEMKTIEIIDGTDASFTNNAKTGLENVPDLGTFSIL